MEVSVRNVFCITAIFLISSKLFAIYCKCRSIKHMERTINESIFYFFNLFFSSLCYNLVIEWCDLVCAGGCGILLWEPLLEIARQLCAQIESWNRFLSGFLPVYAGVLIMGGESSAGAAASGFFLTLLCLLAQALTAFVPPILECFLAMSMACCITEQSCLGNLCKAAGTLLQKGLSLTGKLLAALLGFQRISAAQLDRTALRTGQFLTGTIPIVGQSLSDASEAVLAGIQLLKLSLIHI